TPQGRSLLAVTAAVGARVAKITLSRIVRFCHAGRPLAARVSGVLAPSFPRRSCPIRSTRRPFPLGTKIRIPKVADSFPSPDPSPRPGKVRSRKDGTRPLTARPLVYPVGGRWYLSCKTALDVTAALLLLVLAAPLIGLAALLVKLTSRGPAFYTQDRVGQDGRVFTIYKIRTMIHNAESLTGPR